MTNTRVAFPEGLNIDNPIGRGEVTDELDAVGITHLTIERGKESQTLQRSESGWSFTVGTVLG